MQSPQNIIQTTVTERGQTSIPASLRKSFKLEPGTGLQWMETKEGIFILPIPDDPIAHFRGRGKGKGIDYVASLLEDRRNDRKREKKKLG